MWCYGKQRIKRFTIHSPLFLSQAFSNPTLCLLCLYIHICVRVPFSWLNEKLAILIENTKQMAGTLSIHCNSIKRIQKWKPLQSIIWDSLVLSIREKMVHSSSSYVHKTKTRFDKFYKSWTQGLLNWCIFFPELQTEGSNTPDLCSQENIKSVVENSNNGSVWVPQAST